MNFRALEEQFVSHRKLSAELARLDELLVEIISTGQDGSARTPDLITETVAARLGVDEGLALVLLGAAHRAELLRPRYDIYCPDDGSKISSFSSKQELPARVECSGHVHTIEEYHVALVFELTPAARASRQDGSFPTQ